MIHALSATLSCRKPYIIKTIIIIFAFSILATMKHLLIHYAYYSIVIIIMIHDKVFIFYCIRGVETKLIVDKPRCGISPMDRHLFGLCYYYFVFCIILLITTIVSKYMHWYRHEFIRDIYLLRFGQCNQSQSESAHTRCLSLVIVPKFRFRKMSIYILILSWIEFSDERWVSEVKHKIKAINKRA